MSQGQSNRAIPPCGIRLSFGHYDFAVKDFIYLAKVKVDDDDANEEMCNILDLLSPNEEDTEEYSYE